MLASQKHHWEEQWPETPQQHAPRARKGSPSQHHAFQLAPRPCSIHIQDPEAGAGTLQVGELQVCCPAFDGHAGLGHQPEAGFTQLVKSPPVTQASPAP